MSTENRVCGNCLGELSIEELWETLEVTNSIIDNLISFIKREYVRNPSDGDDLDFGDSSQLYLSYSYTELIETIQRTDSLHDHLMFMMRNLFSDSVSSGRFLPDVKTDWFQEKYHGLPDEIQSEQNEELNQKENDE